MNRRSVLVLGSAAALVACSSTAPVKLGSDGLPLPQVYVIKPGSEAEISFRMLDSVNALRGARNAPPLSFNAELNAAAARVIGRYGVRR